MKKLIALFFIASMIFVACKSTKDASTSAVKVAEEIQEAVSMQTWILGSEMAKCDEAAAEALCLNVKKSGEMDYTPMNILIEGFTYEPGYKYQLEVKIVNSKKEATRYMLVKELFKVAVN